MFSRLLHRIALAGAVFALTACASTSRFEGLTADEVFAMAQAEYANGDYRHAAETLERVLTMPSFTQGAEAQLLIARSYFLDDQFITAQAEYTRFLDRYPAHPAAAEAALGVCKSNAALSPIPQRDQTFTQQAYVVCRNVVSEYAGLPEAEEASRIAVEMKGKLAQKAYDTGEYYLDKGWFDSALIYFQAVVREYADTDWAPKSLVGIIESYTKIGYEDEVAAARAKLLADYPDSPEARSLPGRGAAVVADTGFAFAPRFNAGP